MKQLSLATTGFELVTKRTRKREFLGEMTLVVPWAELVALITQHAPEMPWMRAMRQLLKSLRLVRLRRAMLMSALPVKWLWVAKKWMITGRQ